uniref:Pleckstrin homology and FYVE domain containing 1 n=1 Tax=Neogobius melanostomus TaxID=47308 RepID=A0A8C6UYS9_9GOBI
MTQQMSFKVENQKRIEAVEKSFRPVGIRLVDKDRVLIGEGRLMKQSRRGPQPRAFFLFNDMLVYGSIVINGRWFKRQKVIRLDEAPVAGETPQKSFYVSAASLEEKQAWMEHIELCKARVLQSSGCRPRATFAVTWIPDPASAICMRCTRKFTVTHRRHHCRKCGFLVCGVCSRKRAVIDHIHPTKQLRVCGMCHNGLIEDRRVRGDSSGLRSDEEEQSCDEPLYEDHDDHVEEDYDPIYWADPGMNSFLHMFTLSLSMSGLR